MQVSHQSTSTTLNSSFILYAEWPKLVALWCCEFETLITINRPSLISATYKARSIRFYGKVSEPNLLRKLSFYIRNNCLLMVLMLGERNTTGIITALTLIISLLLGEECVLHINKDIRWLRNSLRIRYSLGKISFKWQWAVFGTLLFTISLVSLLFCRVTFQHLGYFSDILCILLIRSNQLMLLSFFSKNGNSYCCCFLTAALLKLQAWIVVFRTQTPGVCQIKSCQLASRIIVKNYWTR